MVRTIDMNNSGDRTSKNMDKPRHMGIEPHGRWAPMDPHSAGHPSPN